MRRLSSSGHGASFTTGGFSCHQPYGTSWITRNNPTSTASGHRTMRQNRDDRNPMPEMLPPQGAAEPVGT